ncbi:MAG TPA: hypothetical protein VFU15_01565 [Bacteroidia bacterium]|nr:hypothetical protein [Bacteroidia bacterium]
MRSLTEEQIDFIREDIRRRGVFTESLQEDLLDHICCFIEEQPDDAGPFGDVYRRALDAFGAQGLGGVQDELLSVFNHKYLKPMKKLMYISGAFASIALLAGAFFKIQHWPGAGILLVSGTLVLTFFFLPFIFYLQFKEQTEKKGKVITAIGMLTAIMLCAGALFKIMHWPGTIVMIVGFALLFVVFLPLYLINGIRNPLTKLTSMSNGFLVACIGGNMMLLSFRQPSFSMTESNALISRKQESLHNVLQKQWESRAATLPVACGDAVKTFRDSCEAALFLFPQANPQDIVGDGALTDPELLPQFNQRIRADINALNAAMQQQNGWQKIEPSDYGSTVQGNLRFEILQLECDAYLRASALK